jgi:CRISPR-associated endonuclease/helicase Cas3
VVDVSVGGYDGEVGFTREKSDVPASLELAGAPPDTDEADALTYNAADYITLRMHAQDTAEEMEKLLTSLSAATSFVDKQMLVEAARWHDTGKAHEAFQAMLTANLPPGDERKATGPWAKSDGEHGGRNPRRFFRHELASALAWMAAGKSDLGAFVVAAHHGKVRLSLRARPGEEPPPGDGNRRFAHGVYDGDPLPACDLGAETIVPAQVLSLACMELGGGEAGASWADRMRRVLEEHGPFRLAYLEMLIRVADWRASQKRSAKPVLEAEGVTGNV